MAKYMLVFKVSFIYDEGTNDSSREYTVECQPSELDGVIANKKAALVAQAKRIARETGGSKLEAAVSLTQVASL